MLERLAEIIPFCVVGTVGKGPRLNIARLIEIAILLVGIGIFVGRVETKLSTIDVNIVTLERKIDRVWDDFYKPVMRHSSDNND